MVNIPKISEAEWEVMKVIWNNSPCSANYVIENLESKMDWKPKTIKTLISRLVKKEVLAFEIEGRSYNYYPLVKKEDCIKEESKSFLHRVFNGVAKDMVLNFIEDDDLTDEDIEDLKKILEKRK
ncbi:BlaI/MecI/CopY family transcriptional regulator [Clostridium sp. MB40-C1]|uniref:BlaI/MecI/CopY family transcriptional regulator n=1 Tax=Clostridium sp. MB40-C1 TaxID=3070996 RepID=UPI0027E1EFD0|nr:BlaI/MecI/CopY family transcriptional regulator [Clostridium sp. MB40-C1]WMJ81828.1 BlaI/MecI/CopY family transcriptional regulator [Clostridium sp. MB40-C1]